MTKIKIAIIGAGAMAREHARAFSVLPEVQLAGVYSRTKERASQLAFEFGIENICDSVEQLYDKTLADLVVITVPELQAKQVAVQCFQFPWSVFMEKPAGYDMQDATDIADAALAMNSTVMVGLNRRFYSSVSTVKQDLKNFNENRHIHIQDQQSFSEARHYGHPEEVVQKFMYANSIHNIDLIMALSRGEVIAVKPIKPWMGDKTEVMLVYIEFDSGDTALYEGVWQGPGPWACSVSTVSRRWSLQPLETASMQKVGERTRQMIASSEEDQHYKPGFYRQAQEVVKKVLGQANESISLDESMRTMRLINAMFGV